MSKNFTIKMRLDLEALKQQKQTLLDVIAGNKCKHTANDLDGILHLIDGIQDFIVDSKQAKENEVFNTETQNERIKMEHNKKRLEELRTRLRNECISYEELAELHSLAKYIDKGDVELLQAAGVPEDLS